MTIKQRAASRIAHLVGLAPRRKAARKTAPPSGPRAQQAHQPTAVRKPAIIVRCDENDVTEMEGNGPIASARRRERERCHAIVTSAAAASNPELAKGLAFNSDMSRSEAVAFLRGQCSAGDVDPQATAASWDVAMANVNGRRIER